MLTLNDKANQEIIRDALDSFPDECCGFLFGHEENQQRIISLAWPVVNSSNENKTKRFSITPHDYMKAEKFAVGNELDLLGIYHSHPDHPAVPSETDRLSAQPFFSYIIISVVKGELDVIRSWRLNEQNHFEEETIFEKIKT